MLLVNGEELNFDITCPSDIKSYRQAMDILMHNTAVLNELKKEETGIESYERIIEAECNLLCEFIDNLLGEGTCNKCVGKKISVNALYDFCAQIASAINEQAKETNKKFAPYKPNRKRAKTG